MAERKLTDELLEAISKRCPEGTTAEVDRVVGTMFEVAKLEGRAKAIKAEYEREMRELDCKMGQLRAACPHYFKTISEFIYDCVVCGKRSGRPW